MSLRSQGSNVVAWVKSVPTSYTFEQLVPPSDAVLEGYGASGATVLLEEILLIPPVRLRTLPQFLSQTWSKLYQILARTMDTAQVHTWDSQRMILNYISPVFTKAKIHKVTTHFPPLSDEGKYTPWCTSCLCTSHLCDQAHPVRFGNQLCFPMWTHAWLVILRGQHALAFPNGTSYRLDSALLYRSLKHGNLNIKHNFSRPSASLGVYNSSLLPACSLCFLCVPTVVSKFPTLALTISWCYAFPTITDSGNIS